MKVIIDSNVVIAAAASHGLCESVMELCLERHQIVLCDDILREIEEKLRNKIKAPSVVVREYLKMLRDNALVFKPSVVDRKACRDPGDLKILGLVASANADIVITGDKDPLVIGKFKSARILSPRDFWDSNRNDR